MRSTVTGSTSSVAAGRVLDDSALDSCHGRTSSVAFGGKRRTIYHYDATLEYPYTLGCFHGTPVTSALGTGGGGAPPAP
jgi:hypothetical protein